MRSICDRPGHPARVATAVAVALIMASTGSATPPPQSPGLPIGTTTLDLQHFHSMARQVARLPGNDCVHFAWTSWDRLPSDINPNDRYMGYNSYTISTGTLNQGFGGVPPGFEDAGRAGFAEIAVDVGDLANIALHQRQDPGFPYHPWRIKMPIACSALHVDDELGDPGQDSDIGLPRLDIQLGSAQGVVHEIASDGTDTTVAVRRIYYWRNANDVWSGPVLVDSNFTIAYVVAAAPNSDKCAIVLHTDREPQLGGTLNIAFYESFTAGAGWLDYSELGDVNKHIVTNYADRGGSQAWRHISAVYDNSDVLNIIWDERQDTLSTSTIIRHWNSSRGTIRPVAYGLWSNRRASTGGVDLSLAKMTIGVGDGATTCNGESNQNYLYVLYTRFGGPTPTEKADSAVTGFMNGELYLNVSTDGGETWSPPTDLTNTRTPNCFPGLADTTNGNPQYPDSLCRSEHWASLNKVVHDLDILYISDIDAGAITHGEGTWQVNPVVYLRLPGVMANSQFVCPESGPVFVSTYQLQQPGSCGAHGSENDTIGGLLTIANPGNAPLLGEINVVYSNPPNPSELWLNVKGRQTYPFILAAGDPDSNLGVRMYPGGLAGGSYQAELRVSHNDPTQPSPMVYPITLNVDACVCHANPICDAAVDILDVTAVIGRAFRGTSPTNDPFCPSPVADAIDGTTDVNCSGATDVVDVVVMINVAFRGAYAGTSFCHPCAMTL